MQNLQAEKDLHEQVFYIDSGHWLCNPLFVSRERHWLKNEIEKIRFYSYLIRYIRKKEYRNNAKILFAPIGDGNDLKYCQGIYKEVIGIDIASIKLSKCPRVVVTKECNILESGYGDESFDVIITSLLLHHLEKIDFTPFIKEFYRLLRRGGVLAILEPSSFYPFSWVISLLSRLFGPLPGRVKGERPINPFWVIEALRSNGFVKLQVRGMTFNHMVFPSFFQTLINLIDYPLRVFWPFCFFSETIGFFSEKPK